MSRTTESPLGFHQGRALVDAVAGTYQSLHEVLLEATQNAIDAGARTINIEVNEQTRGAFVRDNGSGVTQEELEKGLVSICESRKERGRRLYGRFGRGFVSPLGKCAVFYFTSCSSSQKTPYREWRFETAKLIEQRTDLSIPHRERRDLIFAAHASRSKKRGKQHVSWRTEVRLEGITNDRSKGRIDLARLREAIEERYGEAIKRHQIRIKIVRVDEAGKSHEAEARSQRLRGRKLEVVEITDNQGGTTTFNLFIAPQTVRGRGGKVSVGETNDPFRLSFGKFTFYQRSLGGISQEATTAINSGLFEGEIINDRISLTAGRNNFEQDDALIDFCLAIERWYQEHGKKHVEEVQRQRQDKRLQELGLQSLRVLEQMLRNPEFGALREAILAMRMGTIGEGHAPVSPGKLAGEQETTSIATTGGHGTDREEGKARARRGPGVEEREGHTPLAVLGPQGKSRTAVRANSLGLQIGYVEDSESRQLWTIDRVHGVLYFNVLHQGWRRCDEQGDECIVRLQNHCVLLALICERIPKEWEIVAEMLSEEFPAPLAMLLSAETPRSRHRKS
jgi:hypothetical protein